jgi:hypothetical protein
MPSNRLKRHAFIDGGIDACDAWRAMKYLYPAGVRHGWAVKSEKRNFSFETSVTKSPLIRN